MSVAQSQPHSSKLPNEAGWTAKEAVGMCGCLCCVYCTRSGEFCQHLVHLVSVDPSIHPTDTIRGHLPEVVLQGRDEVVEADLLPEASCLLNVGDGESVHALIVADPEGGIPGLVVCPTVHDAVSFVCCVYCRP